MADAALRAAHRLLAAGHGDAHARAATLASLVRAGRLDRRRVELAAYLGDEAAILVAEPARLKKQPAESARVNEVLRRGGLGQRELVYLASAFAERARSDHPDAAAAIAAARAWADCPCEEHSAAAAAAADAAADAAAAAWAAWEAETAAPAAEAAAWAARSAAWAAWAAASPAWAARSAAAEEAAWAAAAQAAEWSAESSAAWSAAKATESAWQERHVAGRLLDPAWPAPVQR